MERTVPIKKCLIMAFNKTVAEELTERMQTLEKYDNFTPSSYQQVLIDFIMTGSGNAIVQAVAGSGKTTTIMQGLNELRKKYGTNSLSIKMMEEKWKSSEVDYIEYGDIQFKAGTTHAICSQAGKKSIKYSIFANKIGYIINGSKYPTKTGAITLPAFSGYAPEIEGLIKPSVKYLYNLDDKKAKAMTTSLRYQYGGILKRLIGILKNCGVGIFPNRPMEASTAQTLYDYYGLKPFLKGKKLQIYEESFEPKMFEMAIKVLKDSNDLRLKYRTDKHSLASSVWDLDDLFYLTALYDVPMPQYDFIFLDECQDTNLVTQLLLKRMVEKGGRAIAVGDVAQAIYAFRGADANAMTQFAETFKATTIPLSLCYRCGSKIVTEVNQIFNDNTEEFPYTQIQSLPSAPDGMVFHAGQLDKMSGDQVKALFNNKTAVICRKNAPLVSLVTKLFVYQIPVNFLGRNDLGKSVIGLFEKYKSIFKKGFAYDTNNKAHNYNKKVGSSISKYLKELNKYQDNEFNAFTEAGEVDKIDKLNDDVACVYHLLGLIQNKFGDDEATSENVETLVNELFSEDAMQNAVTFTTVHRSKGLEFHRVIILDYTEAFMPDWVHQSHLYEQECNMAYVALTRAEKELIFLNS